MASAKGFDLNREARLAGAPPAPVKITNRLSTNSVEPVPFALRGPQSWSAAPESYVYLELAEALTVMHGAQRPTHESGPMEATDRTKRTDHRAH